MPNVRLTDRALILVAGEDAEHFLQNILTTDLSSLGDDEARPGALLTPQGKILFDFLISKSPGGYRLDCRRDVATDFARRLTLYKLRAKVTIVVEDQALVAANWEADSVSSGIDSTTSRFDSTASHPESTLRDARFPIDAGISRVYGAAARPDNGSAGGVAAWNALRVAHGIAESGSDYMLGDAFPHDVLLDQTGGVGFRKGCYVGQEVVSRMQHRGTARRRVLIASADAPLPAPGTPVEAGGRPLGALGTVSGTKALAVVRIDRVKEAMDAGQPIAADGVALTLSIPAWAGFTFPEAPAESAAGEA
ncbi:MAG: folate-binding protein YgfZ [Rhizobiaceae bacterium]|nr:MAG: folate-binding protein YgfZ [Rhizobiaceae bacterium]CAG0975267.1 tRNA-modifying protein YgfZ [Rhizobiaceae bacterium]